MSLTECTVDGVVVHYADHGSGIPLVVLHGGGLDHREMEAAIEPVVPHDRIRRIYPDLPGMGRTRAPSTLDSNDAVVSLMRSFVDQVAGEPALLLGHSYGGYLARGIAARAPERTRGLALLCPIGAETTDLPEQTEVRREDAAYDELSPDLHEDFDEYFVIRTAEMARRYRDYSVPGTQLADDDALGRIANGWRIDLPQEPLDIPVLIVAGRRDSTVGYRDAIGLLDGYPAATLAVLEDAGHALPHEQPELLRALVGDWVTRATR